MVSLNLDGRTATLVRALLHPGARVAVSQGNVQQLSDDTSLVDWGQAGVVSELNTKGQLTFDRRCRRRQSSYRAYRQPWKEAPHTPAVVACTVPGGHRERVRELERRDRRRVLAGRGGPDRFIATGDRSRREGRL